MKYKIGDLVKINCGTLTRNISGIAVITRYVGSSTGGEEWVVMWLKIYTGNMCCKTRFLASRMRKLA